MAAVLHPRIRLDADLPSRPTPGWRRRRRPRRPPGRGPGRRRRAGAGADRHRPRHPRGLGRFVQPPQRPGAAPRGHVPQHPGLIDAGYRDEPAGAGQHRPGRRLRGAPGDRIAQLVIQRVEHATFAPVEALEESERGAPAASLATPGCGFWRSLVSENDERTPDRSVVVGVGVGQALDEPGPGGRRRHPPRRRWRRARRRPPRDVRRPAGTGPVPQPQVDGAGRRRRRRTRRRACRRRRARAPAARRPRPPPARPARPPGSEPGPVASPAAPPRCARPPTWRAR